MYMDCTGKLAKIQYSAPYPGYFESYSPGQLRELFASHVVHLA